MNDPDVMEIRANYNNEEIQYYYDVVFGPEGLGNVNNETVKKHVKEIKYYIFGKPSDDIIALTKKAFDTLAQLTSLNISPAIKKEESNFLVFFIDRENVTMKSKDIKGSKVDINISKNIRGLAGESIDKKGAIISSNAVIFNDLPKKAIPHVLLEEITQSFGLSSDSFRYLNSIFYEGESYVNQLSDLDKQIIRLHYSPYIRTGLTKTAFYDAFKDVLQTLTWTEELNVFEDFIKEISPSKEAIDMFCEFAFSKPNKFISEGHIQKFSANQIIAKGVNNPIIDSVFTILIKEIPYITFKKLEDEDTETFNLSYKHIISTDTIPLSNFNRYWNKIIDYQLYESDVFYNEKITSKVNNKIIIRNTLSALGLNFGRKSRYAKYSHLLSYNDTLVFSKYDRELLKLFLHPSLKSGMTKIEIYRILKKHYHQNDILKSDEPYEELAIHLKDLNLSKKAYDMFYKNMSKGNIITKWENKSDIIYRVKNELTLNDSIFLKTVLKKFDDKMENVQFLEDNDDILDELVDLNVDYGYRYGSTEKICDLSGKLFCDKYDDRLKILKIDIQTLNKNSIERNECILDNFFKMLLDVREFEEELYTAVTETSFEFTDLGSEILQVYYHPTFQNGMQKEKILKILQE